MIHIADLTVRYDEAPVLQEISLAVAKGECLLVTGPSGCGKSTFGRVLSGLIPHAIPAKVEGRVQIDGKDLLSSSIPEIAQSVGMVFQRPATQLFHLKVEDEVAFGPYNLGLSDAEVFERTEWALQVVGLQAFRKAKPSELSGGQKQCVAIASVLAMRPQVLVLDEPTASLDVPNTGKVIETLYDLRTRYGITIILIEHRLAEAVQLADRVILMDEGRIVSDGDPEEVFADFELRNRLGLRRPTEEPSVSWDTLIKLNDTKKREKPPLLTFESVSAGFNGHAVIHDIQLEIHPGEFLALVGDNGAGKSTLAMAAAGLIKTHSGAVKFLNGKRPRPGLDVAILLQDPEDQLFTDSVDEELSFGATNYHIFNPNHHQEILQKADLTILKHMRPRSLSVGQQQRTALAACLELCPKLLILDEPTLGQDWGHLQRLMNYLKSLNEQGMTILLISHDYKLVHHYARRIILMKDGRIQQIGRLSTGSSVDKIQ